MYTSALPVFLNLLFFAKLLCVPPTLFLKQHRFIFLDKDLACLLTSSSFFPSSSCGSLLPPNTLASCYSELPVGRSYRVSLLVRVAHAVIPKLLISPADGRCGWSSRRPISRADALKSGSTIQLITTRKASQRNLSGRSILLLETKSISDA